MTQIEDPRPHYSAALTWVHQLMHGVHPAQLDAPTPCSEFDVHALLAHLVGTVERARVIGEGGDPWSVPLDRTDVPDTGWADAYESATVELWKVWSDDAALDRIVTPPWGTVPGHAAVRGYLNETLVHGWDLAVATGQNPEADHDLATTALAGARRFIPAEPRGGPIPFGPVVPSAPDAGPTEQLANWSGHRRP